MKKYLVQHSAIIEADSIHDAIKQYARDIALEYENVYQYLPEQKLCLDEDRWQIISLANP